jgi:hypothetical protein
MPIRDTAELPAGEAQILRYCYLEDEYEEKFEVMAVREG